jgi:hypothetical protein
MRMASVTMGLILLSAVHVGAQARVVLEFNGNLVTLHAENAPVSTILAEWARLGGTTVVNGDRLAGRLVTLDLTAVPERRALAIVLRDVPGYMLAQRVEGSQGLSAFGRLVVVPTSAAPTNAASPPAAGTAGPRPPVPLPPVLAARFPQLGVEGRPPRPAQGDARGGALPLPPAPMHPEPVSTEDSREAPRN